MTPSGQLITGRQARAYDYRGTLWSRIKLKHLSLIDPKPGQRVLDVGCGTGKTLQLLSQKCDKSVQLFGLEPSPDMFRQARAKLGKRAKLHQGFAQKLPYPAAHFDFVVTTQVLHHLPLAEKKKMLAEMHRVLKPGGTLVVSDWGRPVNTLGKAIGFLWRRHAWVSENTDVMNTTSFGDTGFTRVTETIQFGILRHIVAMR